MRPALTLCLSVLCVAPATAAADAGQLGKLVGEVVRSRYGELHACYRKALAIDRRRGGTVFVKVTLGRADKVARAKVARDELRNAAVARCLEAKVARWTFVGTAAAGAVRGSELYLPLTFRGDPGQQAVAAGDLGWPPRYDGSVALLTSRNSGASGVTGTLAATRAVQESQLSRARLLVLVKGRASLGKRRRSAPSVALLPAGSDAELEPDKRVELLTLSLPSALARKAKAQLWGLGPRLRSLAPGVAARAIALKAKGTLRQGSSSARRVLFVLSGTARLSRPGKVGGGRQVGPNTAIYWPKGGKATLIALGPCRLVEVRLP